MVDLPDTSIIVARLEHWRHDKSKLPIIQELRLVAKLRTLLEVSDLTLRNPPPARDQDYGQKTDIVGWRFPSGSVDGRIDSNGDSRA